MYNILELQVDSIDSALTALNYGANRLVLCSSLAEGGITPTTGLLIHVQKNKIRKIPIYCLLRCRLGNYTYHPHEVKVMKKDAKVLRQNGADGFVFGAVTVDGQVDIKVCRKILKVCHPLPVTFNRAFECVKRPTIELEVLIDLGFNRLITSGKQKTAQQGIKMIKKIAEIAGDRLVVTAEGGINKNVVKYLLENADITEIHASFKVVKKTTIPVKLVEVLQSDESPQCSTTDNEQTRLSTEDQYEDETEVSPQIKASPFDISDIYELAEISHIMCTKLFP